MTDLGACLRHPSAAAVFRCRQCLDRLCGGCRASGERDLCGVCLEAFERMDTAAGLTPEGREARRVQSRAGWLIIVVLAVVDVALALTWLLALRSAPSADIETRFAAAEAIARAVETTRAATGRLPTGLEEVLPRVPEPVAEMARAGRVAYVVVGEGAEYAVTLPLESPPGGVR